MRSRISSLAALVCLLLAGIYLVKTVPDRVQHLTRSYDTFKPPPLSGLNSELISILTLGHKHVYDDFINIWLLQTLIDPKRPDDPEKMMQSIRAVIRHHPELETTYLLSCMVMFDDFGSPKHCQEISLEGLKAFPKSWRIPILQGYIHAFLLKEPAQAASFFLMASSREKAPPWVKRLVKKLLKDETINQQDLDTSINILEQSSNTGSFLNFIEQMKKMSERL